MVNGSRRLVDCNERYAEMAGRSKAELIEIGNTGKLQKKVGSVTPNVDNQTLRAQHIPYRGVVSWLRPDGKENMVEYAAMPVEINGKPFTIGMDRDITERVKMQDALDQRARQLEALAHELQIQNDELDAFGHMVAHDLKNPLTMMMAAAEILGFDYVETLAAEDQNYFQVIVDSARRMNTIIDELLVLAATRRQEIACRPLEMGSIVEAALAQLGHLMEAHQPVVEWPEAWPIALGHAPWVERVWANYLGNAILYGGQPPRLTIGATAADNGTICFWVQDNGAGLTAEEQAKLFTPFTRLRQGRAKGHGLGLSIVQRIVKRLGGRVAVESQPGQGSIFQFTLPAA